MKISIIGAGSYGTALAVNLQKHGHDIKLWCFLEEECSKLLTFRENRPYLPSISIPNDVYISTDLANIVNDAQLVILAVPSHAISQTCSKLRPLLRDGLIVANVAKGFSGIRTLSDEITEKLPLSRVVVLSGPSHAEEVAKCNPTTNVAASSDLRHAEYVQKALMNENFRVYINDDVIGVELGGALKNIIALACGISDGLGFGDNMKAALITRGIVEMTRLAVKLGAKESTLSGLSGVGDLIATCTSRHSRNLRAGTLIGQGYSLDEAQKEVKMVVEGVYATKTALELGRIHSVELPIIEKVGEILYCNKPPRDTVLELMTREPKQEFDVTLKP